MRILSIDTTASGGSVAISEGGLLLAQEQQGTARTHAERLLGSVSHLMEVAGIGMRDLQGIAVAIGPGSFTGLRIGLATAKAFSLAGNIPIAGVSSLVSLALNGAGFAGIVVPLIDARRGELYAYAAAVNAAGRITEVLPESVSPPGAVVERLAALPGELLLVGDGALVYRDSLLHALGDRATVALGAQLRPQAVGLARLAQERLARGGDDVALLAPNYIRRSDAEIGFRGNA